VSACCEWRVAGGARLVTEVVRGGGGAGEQPAAGARPPTASEIRAAIARILASRSFEQASRSSRFLEYVADQTLSGQGDRLKGYTIAVEVFGRPPDFDGQSDPLVRVEAGRLRRRLLEYYGGEGKDDALRIDLPRGSYGIVAAYAAPAEAEPPASAAAEPTAERVAEVASPRRRWRRWRAILVTIVILAALTVVALQNLAGRSSRTYPTLAEVQAAGGRPPIVVLPFEDLSTQRDLRSLANTLTEEVLLLLDAPELFVVATEPQAGGGSGREGPVVASATAGAAYVLSGSVREAAEGVRVTARLVVAASGTQIWSGAFDEPVRFENSRVDQQRVARAIAAVASPYGPIFEVELERIRPLAPAELTTRDRVLEYYDYRRALDPGRHAVALECFPEVGHVHAIVFGDAAQRRIQFGVGDLQAGFLGELHLHPIDDHALEQLLLEHVAGRQLHVLRAQLALDQGQPRAQFVEGDRIAIHHGDDAVGIDRTGTGRLLAPGRH